MNIGSLSAVQTRLILTSYLLGQFPGLATRYEPCLLEKVLGLWPWSPVLVWTVRYGGWHGSSAVFNNPWRTKYKSANPKASQCPDAGCNALWVDRSVE